MTNKRDKMMVVMVIVQGIFGMIVGALAGIGIAFLAYSPRGTLEAILELRFREWVSWVVAISIVVGTHWLLMGRRAYKMKPWDAAEEKETTSTS